MNSQFKFAILLCTVLLWESNFLFANESLYSKGNKFHILAFIYLCPQILHILSLHEFSYKNMLICNRRWYYIINLEKPTTVARPWYTCELNLRMRKRSVDCKISQRSYRNYEFRFCSMKLWFSPLKRRKYNIEIPIDHSLYSSWKIFSFPLSLNLVACLWVNVVCVVVLWNVREVELFSRTNYQCVLSWYWHDDFKILSNLDIKQWLWLSSD